MSSRFSRSLLLALALLFSSQGARARGTLPLPEGEHEALVAFYRATGGNHWLRSEGWLGPPTTECNWEGVECGCFEAPGLPCPYVRGLDFYNNNLRGALPEEIRNLRLLHTLDIQDFALTGPLPAALWTLHHLQYLNLIASQTGVLPSAIGKLENLEYAVILGDFTGSLPAQLGRLGKLETLGLVGDFTGRIPRSLGNLTRLTRLDLLGALTGPIPPELGNLVNLREIYLGQNRLAGPVPSELGRLTKLQLIGLGGNRLSGEIPSSILSWTDVQSIDFAFNALFAPNPEVDAFVGEHQLFANWHLVQTYPPSALGGEALSPSSARLAWTLPQPLFSAPGGYFVEASRDPSGPFRVIARIDRRRATSAVLTELTPGRTYYLRLRAFTLPHAENPNIVTSVPSNLLAIELPLPKTATGPEMRSP